MKGSANLADILTKMLSRALYEQGREALVSARLVLLAESLFEIFNAPGGLAIFVVVAKFDKPLANHTVLFSFLINAVIKYTCHSMMGGAGLSVMSMFPGLLSAHQIKKEVIEIEAATRYDALRRLLGFHAGFSVMSSSTQAGRLTLT